MSACLLASTTKGSSASNFVFQVSSRTEAVPEDSFSSASRSSTSSSEASLALLSSP